MATAIVLASPMALVFAVVLVHCAASTSPVIAASQPSYREQVAPILQKNCLDCHSSVAHRGGLILDSYEALMKGGKHGPAISPRDANGSRMIGMMEGKIDPQMPFNADPLPESDIAAIRAWIDAGAEGPPADESTKVVAPLQTPDIQTQVTVVSPVTAVKFSPDGKMLAVGGYREVRATRSLVGQGARSARGTRRLRSFDCFQSGREFGRSGRRGAATFRRNQNMGCALSSTSQIDARPQGLHLFHCLEPEWEACSFGKLRQDGKALGREHGQGSAEFAGSY